MIEQGCQKTIFLVDDQESIRHACARVLRQNGYEVLTADSPASASQVWEQNAQRIDMLLSDVLLEDTTDGFDLAQRFQTQKPDLKVAFMSGYAPESFNPAAKPKFFLQKPFHCHQLSRMIRDCLNS